MSDPALTLPARAPESRRPRPAARGRAQPRSGQTDRNAAEPRRKEASVDSSPESRPSECPAYLGSRAVEPDEVLVAWIPDGGNIQTLPTGHGRVRASGRRLNA